MPSTSSKWHKRKNMRVTCRYHVLTQMTINAAKLVIVKNGDDAQILLAALH